jgi:hypothetical protein
MLLWRKIQLVQILHILQVWEKILAEVLQPSAPLSALPTVPVNWRIAENALVAMTLLIAESRPGEKDLLLRVLVHLIHPEKP